MSLISVADQERLRADFAALVRPVRLVFFTRLADCDSCQQARQVLDELPPLSDRIIVDAVDFSTEREQAEVYGIDHVPAIAIVGQDEAGRDRDSHIRFLGTPSGYEFISLIRAILLVGGGPSLLSAESRARISAVDRPMTLRVFTTPTCSQCPRAVVVAHEMAFANPHITAYAVEATEYPDLARRYRVTGVPKTVVDDRLEILGPLPDDAFVEQALAPEHALRNDEVGNDA